MKRFLGVFDLKNALQLCIILTIVVYALIIISGVIILEKRREEEKKNNASPDLESKGFWHSHKGNRQFIVAMVIMLVDVLVNVCLFFALRNGTKWLFVPWLLFRSLLIIGLAVLFSGRLAKGFEDDNWSQQFHGNRRVVSWVLNLVALVVFLYLFWATLSLLYLKTEDGRHDGVRRIRVVPVGQGLYGELPPAYSEKAPEDPEGRQVSRPPSYQPHPEGKNEHSTKSCL